MAILIVGGAGYVGSHTVYALLEQDRDWDIIVADNLSAGHRGAVHPRAKFYQADIRDRAALDVIFKKERIEGVIHFAASIEVGESMKTPLKYYENNLGGSITLLAAMEAAGVEHLVFSSTAAVYGEPEQIPIREEDPTVPRNCYGETKLAAERMLDWLSRRAGLNYAALRYFNACGAHPGSEIGECHKPETHLIPLILQVPNGQREAVAIYGDDYPSRDGTCVRDYIHVMDLAEAHILALDYLMQGGESGAYNLGNGSGFTVREVIEAARRVTGHPIPATIAPRRPGDPAQLVASAEKAQRMLGWRPKYDNLDQIVESAWKWHKANPRGFGDAAG